MPGITIKTLFQGETWTDATGTEHRIDEMSARYCRNVIAFLDRQAQRIAFAVGFAMASGPQPTGEAANDCFDAAMADLDDPVRWLHGTTLVEALRRQADNPDGHTPFGCRYCGIEQHSHARQWTRTVEVGWHAWATPTQQQIKARMQARRAARRGGEDA